ncbi:MFS transporter [Streptacidiphilus sp. PB12-B1b]|uniref:MFS transporter n=1 Tax=Streptacidiphilus sp. PB12-B1b TaxID=2705012 RepID=UPI0015FBB150|nr:MFS transporter [Streptacidiphilus sp. PB12-B1b]QMU78152.1 MFS transporter [Streptacidiphilus sp. PB12-B1b]
MSTTATSTTLGSEELSPRRAWCTFAVVLFASFMDMIDLGIVSVAVPSVQRSLHADYDTAQWFVAAYALAFAVMLIPGGRLGDLYGRKRVFQIGVTGFTLTSAACALAPSAGALIAARFVQGGFGALMVPQVLAVLQVLFPAARRGPALAAYGTVLNLAQLSGPVLGGVLTTDNVFGLGWRAIFLVNVPVGILVVAGTALLLPEYRSDRGAGLDPVGVLLVALLSVLVIYPLQQGRAAGWPVWMIAALVAALPTGLLFVRHQHRTGPAALVPPTLFRSRVFMAGIALLLLVYSGICAEQMIVIWETQVGLGWPALRTGEATIGWVLGLGLLGGPVVGLAQRFGRRLLTAGCLVVAVGSAALGRSMAHDDLRFWPLFGWLTVIGLGLGLVVPILIDLVLSGIPRRDAGGGAGVANAVVYLSSAIGIGVIGLIFFGQVAAGGAAHARAEQPRLGAALRSAGVAPGPAAADGAAFDRCVHDRADSLDPYRLPADCLAGPAAEPLVARSVTTALRTDFGDAAGTGLWYPVAAFLVALLLIRLLPPSSAPGAASDMEDGPGPARD